MLPLILLLAQACVGEIDLQGNPDECAAMWHILDDKANTYEELEYVTKRYISIFKVSSERSRWIKNLNHEGTEPEGFPKNAKWEGPNKTGWIDILNRAEYFIENPGRHPCPKANHFGGPVDGKHADDIVPMCWVRVDCGKGFVQAYYRRPSKPCTVKAADVRRAFSKADRPVRSKNSGG